MYLAGYKCGLDFYVPKNVNRKTLKKHLAFQILNLIEALNPKEHFKKEFYIFFFVRNDKKIEKELVELVTNKYEIEPNIVKFGKVELSKDIAQMYICENDI